MTDYQAGVAWAVAYLAIVVAAWIAAAAMERR